MTTPAGHRWRTVLGLTIVLTALLIAGAQLSGVQSDWVDMLRQMRENPRMLLTATAVYALCLAIPYIPGVELGLLLMIVFGRPGVVMAYGGTVAGLVLAFLLGLVLRRYFLDHPALASWRERARHFRRDSTQQLRQSRLGTWLQPRLARFHNVYPYLVVGLLFNLPGNWLIGGGGGIALVSGLSGRLSWLPFVVTVVVATCAVPLLVWFGLIELERWLPIAAPAP